VSSLSSFEVEHVLAASRTRSSFLVFSFSFFFHFPFLAGDIGQMNLPEGVQSVSFYDCKGITGTAELEDE
jgi:hypothetical protein